jgi:hypothetical protein
VKTPAVVAPALIARVRRKLSTLRSLSWADRGRVAEAAVLLAAARAAVLVLPYRALERWLRFERGREPSDGRRIADVRCAVETASRNLPFAVACLPQAMAAKLMLARRGCRSSLVIGAGRDGDDLLLHAWLEAGGMVVTGQAGRRAMTAVVRYDH